MLVSAVNFSEGKQLDVVSSIGSAAAQFCRLLDIHADPDHNRSVITLAGEPVELIDGILAASGKALPHIDLRAHEGVHPRIGAVDVVPIAPLGGSDPGQAVAAARTCARRLWNELAIPSFLYDFAGSDKQLTLPAVRLRAFKDLKPDIGGDKPHPTAGAACVGVREFLVAYNLNLATDDIGVARAIAASVRQDSRLPNVRSLAFLLAQRGLVQVSCNLLRPGVTTMADVFDAVEEQCSRLNIEILESELVGLAPRVALGGRRPSQLHFIREPKLLEEVLV